MEIFKKNYYFFFSILAHQSKPAHLQRKGLQDRENENFIFSWWLALLTHSGFVLNEKLQRYDSEIDLFFIQNPRLFFFLSHFKKCPSVCRPTFIRRKNKVARNEQRKKKTQWFLNSKNMKNFEVYIWSFSSSISPLFLKSAIYLESWFFFPYLECLNFFYILFKKKINLTMYIT